MLDKINEMEKICLDTEKKGLSSDDCTKLTRLNNRLHENFIKYYTQLEDILFPELEKVLPSPTSTTSMRNEHKDIILVNNRIANILKEGAGQHDEDILSSVYALSDLIQRHFHKKNNVMYHEVSSFLSETVQGEIYSKILKRKQQ